jgi:hypothetical protein
LGNLFADCLSIGFQNCLVDSDCVFDGASFGNVKIRFFNLFAQKRILGQKPGPKRYENFIS